MQGDAGPKLSTLIGRLVGHVAFSTGSLIALAIPAVLLSLAAHYLEGSAVSPLVVSVLEDLSYFVPRIDAVTFVLFLLFSAYLAISELLGYLTGR